jgi:hypothetical protein
MEQELDVKIKNIFTYHPPTDEQKLKYEAIRSKAMELAKVIYENTPMCADQSSAIRQLRDAVMTANASIALNGAV